MKNRYLKQSLVFAVSSALLSGAALAADGDVLNDPAQKFSYALGMSLGNNLKRSGVDPSQINIELMQKGLKDAAGGTPLLDDNQAREAIMAFQKTASEQLAAKNKKAAEDFLAANKSKEGIVTTASGLQYKVLTVGSGESPKASDTVTVNYKGTLLDGSEFDSSYKRGQPASFGVGQVIKGWTEALQLMKPGAKYQLYISPELAYGERGRPGIPPNSLLVFDVELISNQPQPPAAAPAASAQPVTSDIIKVPSKEELEKGAKIEVIKAADLEKLKQQEAEKAKAQPEKK